MLLCMPFCFFLSFTCRDPEFVHWPQGTSDGIAEPFPSGNSQCVRACSIFLRSLSNRFEARRIGHDIKEQQELQVLLTAPEFRKYNTHTIFFGFWVFLPVIQAWCFCCGRERFCVTVTGRFSEAIGLRISGHHGQRP